MKSGARHPKLPHLQCLRALAACGVVFLHAQMQAERFSASAPFISAGLAEFGRHGIDLFFVISGFVIYYTNFPQALPSRTFLQRRALRIVPLYWIFTLLAFAMRWVLPDTLFSAASPGLSALAASLTFLTGRQPIILAGWTLEFEMFFYLCAALAIALLGARWSGVVYVLCALAIGGTLLPIEISPLDVLMDPFLLEFAFGLIAAEIFCTGHVPAPKIGACAIALLLTWPDSASVIWAGLPAAVVVYGAARLGLKGSSHVATRIGYELGNASYSIYLIQFFTLPVIARAIHFAFHGQTPNLVLVAGFFGTLAAGYVCYLWLERPLLSLAKAASTRAPSNTR